MTRERDPLPEGGIPGARNGAGTRVEVTPGVGGEVVPGFGGEVTPGFEIGGGIRERIIGAHRPRV